MAEYNKPVPGVTPDSKEYWAGCRRHELLIQRCSDCGTHRFYPGPMCHAFDCLSMDFEWVQASGKGTVYTLTVVARAPNDMWADLAPYALVLIELDEGPVMFSRAVDIPAFDVRIGMRMEVVWDDLTPEVTLPLFRPISESQSDGEESVA